MNSNLYEFVECKIHIEVDEFGSWYIIKSLESGRFEKKIQVILCNLGENFFRSQGIEWGFYRFKNLGSRLEFLREWIEELKLKLAQLNTEEIQLLNELERVHSILKLKSRSADGICEISNLTEDILCKRFEEKNLNYFYQFYNKGLGSYEFLECKIHTEVNEEGSRYVIKSLDGNFERKVKVRKGNLGDFYRFQNVKSRLEFIEEWILELKVASPIV